MNTKIDLTFAPIKESETYKAVKDGKFYKLTYDGEEMICPNIYIKTLLVWGMIKEDKRFDVIKIDSSKYLEHFRKGYISGREYCQKTYILDPRETRETMVGNLTHRLKEISKVLTRDERIISEEVFFNYGYYSGFYFEILQYEKDYQEKQNSKP